MADRVRFEEFDVSVQYLEERITPEGECWRWTGTKNGKGYGVIRAGDTGLAHRFSYQLLVGAIPDGLVLDHLCRNTMCVNPYHLEPVTQAVNVLRGTGRTVRNARKTHCPKGHPYSEANTYITPTTGARTCRQCRAAMARRVELRRQAERRARRAQRCAVPA